MSFSLLMPVPVMLLMEALDSTQTSTSSRDFFFPISFSFSFSFFFGCFVLYFILFFIPTFSFFYKGTVTLIHRVKWKSSSSFAALPKSFSFEFFFLYAKKN